MNETEIERTISAVKECYGRMTECSSKAELANFLSYYDNSPYFMSLTADGKMNNYEEFESGCAEYYNALKEQKLTTIKERFQVLDEKLVIVGWTGHIVATFKKGDSLIMNNYTITSVFKKINEQWKVIHDHESAPPPQLVKKNE